MNKATAKKTLLFAAGLLALAAAAALRFKNLGALPLSGDEGFTYLAVKGILEHGYPLYPSGDVYYKSILYSYAAALPALVLGINEFALRLPNAVMSLALPVLVFCALKTRAGRGPALVAALVSAFSVWQVEFSREARYYCQLQFFFTGALVVFFSAYMQGRTRLRPLFFAAALAAVFTLNLAIALIVLFLLPPLFSGARVLRERAYLAWFAATAAVFGAWELFEIFFWKMASINPKGPGLLDSVLQIKHSFYFLKAYAWLFPKMTAVAAAGLMLNAGLYLRRLLFRKTHPQLRFMTFANLAFFSILLLMGFGKAHYEPRYIFFSAPLFFMLYAMTLGLVADWLRRCAGALACRAGLGATLGRVPPAAFAAARVLCLTALLFATAEGLDPALTVKIASRACSDRIAQPKYTSSTSRALRWDCRTTGEYVKARLEPGDVVVGTHMVFAQVYAGRCDYWLWTAGAGAWNAFRQDADGRTTDTYLGRPLIRSLGELKALLEENAGRRVWVITTPSVADHNHISPDIRAFLTEESGDKTVCRGTDGVSAVLLFENAQKQP